MTVRLNLGSGSHPLDGFVNLDAVSGWRFEDGLGDYPDGSVDGVTISHALMYVDISDWPFVFAEIARVLATGGVVRVTEDATDDPESERFGGYWGAATLTSALVVAEHMEAAGLSWGHAEKFSWFGDDSLMQSWHGGSPKCFFMEGVKR